jgi:CheY-like chemotaxis protein
MDRNMLTQRSAEQRRSSGQPRVLEPVVRGPVRQESGGEAFAAQESSAHEPSHRGHVCSAGSSAGGAASSPGCASASGVSSVSSGRPPCALIVDDDPEICRALARCLKPELDVHLAGSVREAEVTLAGLARVDLAFVDWMLPDGSGELILEQLVRWPDSIRVLISGRLGSSQGVSVDTTSSENPLRNRALANLVLSKPLAFHVVDALKRATLGLPNG